MKPQTSAELQKHSTTDSCPEKTDTEWIATTQTAQWQRMSGLISSASGTTSASHATWDVEVQLDTPLQTIDGFGACFNELGWTSLGALSDDDREAILEDPFGPGVGANFSICRMPIGANDFSRDWYSYDEVPGDFALEHFSIANDFETLVPFIKSVLRYQPELRLWAFHGARRRG
jgi:glucosylceramidase